ASRCESQLRAGCCEFDFLHRFDSAACPRIQGVFSMAARRFSILGRLVVGLFHAPGSVWLEVDRITHRRPLGEIAGSRAFRVFAALSFSSQWALCTLCSLARFSGGLSMLEPDKVSKDILMARAGVSGGRHSFLPFCHGHGAVDFGHGKARDYSRNR